MTQEEAIATAMAVAGENQWRWLEPVIVSRRRRYFLVGDIEWRVVTHSNARGGNVRITIDDRTRRVTYAGLSPQ
jgi:hypothetical protein